MSRFLLQINTEAIMQLLQRQKSFEQFKIRLENELLNHPIILQNDFTTWFAEGDFNLEQIRHFTVQFSVFSNLFLIAQTKKMINSVNMESMRAAKEILASEIGVIYKSKKKQALDEDSLVVTNGSINGGTFRFQAAHFEWLLNFAAPLDLGFPQMGKRSHGTTTTLHFTDELERLYGSEDFITSVGASFAIENWANRGFWKQLVRGLKIFRVKSGLPLNLGFFVWHDQVEDQHAEHTWEELEELFMDSSLNFDEDAFIEQGKKMLDGVQVFWEGLMRDSNALTTQERKTTVA
jgi:hypothetical protein